MPSLRGVIKGGSFVTRLPPGGSTVSLDGAGVAIGLAVVQLLLDLVLGLVLVLILGTIVLGNVVREHAVGDADNVEEPEQVEGLERDEERGGNVQRKGALVLLSLPVNDVRTDGLELIEQGPDDAEVNVVAEVDPRTHKDCIKGG